MVKRKKICIAGTQGQQMRVTLDTPKRALIKGAQKQDRYSFNFVYELQSIFPTPTHFEGHGFLIRDGDKEGPLCPLLRVP